MHYDKYYRISLVLFKIKYMIFILNEKYKNTFVFYSVHFLAQR